MQGQGVVFVTGDRLGDPVAVRLALTTFPAEDWLPLFSETDVLVVSPGDVWPREIMEAAPRLRGLVSCVMGVDTIDMEAATDLWS